MEEQCDTSTLIMLDREDSEPPASPSTTDFSPCEFKFNGTPPSPLQPLSPMVQFQQYSAGAIIDLPHKRSHLNSSPLAKHGARNVHLPSSPSTTGSSSSTSSFEPRVASQRPSSRAPPPVPMEFQTSTYSVTPSTSTQSTVHGNKTSPISVNQTALSTSLPAARCPRVPSPRLPMNRVSSLCLWAEGMAPFTVQVDYLKATAHSPIRPLAPIALRIKLRLSSIDDIRSPPTLHGFHGTLSFASPWTLCAKCVTKVYASNSCISVEAESLQLAASNVPAGYAGQTVTAFLPESSLSRSRWLNSGVCLTLVVHYVLVQDL